jgi:hypothetical protein
MEDDKKWQIQNFVGMTNKANKGMKVVNKVDKGVQSSECERIEDIIGTCGACRSYIFIKKTNQ